MNEDLILKATEKFKELITTQNERALKIKEQHDFTDFAALDTIVIGVCGGDGIGPSITAESARVLSHLLDDEVKRQNRF